MKPSFEVEKRMHLSPSASAEMPLQRLRSRAGATVQAALLLLCALLASQAFALDPPWTAIGPNAATVFSLERDPSNANTLFAGTFFGGLYKSIDSGRTWRDLPGPLTSLTIFAVAIDPTNQSILYAGTFGEGVFKSSDGGTTWVTSSNGLATTGLQIQAIAIDPRATAVVLVATDQGVFRSTDAGANWSPVTGGLNTLPVKTLVFETSIPGLVYAGTSGAGVFRSTDSGQSWTQFTLGIGQQNITRMSRDSATNTVYAATGVGVFHMLAGDTQWRSDSYNLAGTKINFALRVPNQNSLLAATDSGIYQLTGSGPASTWSKLSEARGALLSVHPVSGRIHIATIFRSFVYTDDFTKTFLTASEGIHNAFIGAIESVDYNGTSLIYAGTDFGVGIAAERSRTDSSPPWFVDYPFPGAVFDVVKHPTVPGRLFAGSEVGGVWRSDHWGLYWVPSSNGIVPARITALTQATTLGTPLYAATSSGLAVSYDDGRNWVVRKISSTSPLVTAAFADRDRPGHAFFGTNDGKIFRTIDYGTNFANTATLPDDGEVRAIEASHFLNIYAVSGAGKLYVSQDVGITFFPVGSQIVEPVLSVTSDPARPWIAYVGTVGGGVYKTESNAITWEARNTGIDIPYIAALAVDSGATDTLYAGAVGAIYRSIDGGAHWLKLAGTLPAQLVNAIKIDSTSGALYASVERSGVYKSTNGGSSWTQVLSGKAFAGQVPVELSKVSPGTMFAGSTNEGVYRSTDSGASWTQSSNGMGLFVRSLAIDPDQPDNMFATSIGAGIFKSIDGGAHWLPKGLADGNLLNVAIDHSPVRKVYAATSEGIARSTDGGESWENLAFRTPFIFAMASDPTVPGRLVGASSDGEIFQSTSAGVAWAELTNNGLPKDVYTAITVDPSTGAIYVGSESLGVFRLDVGASRWQGLGPNNLPPHSVITALVIEPTNNVVFATTAGGGAYASLNKGANWFPVDTGVPNHSPTMLAYDPTDKRRLLMTAYVDTPNQAGLYSSTNSGTSWQPVLFAGNNGRSVVFSAKVAGQVFAASDHSLARSTDGGRTWQTLPASFGSGDITSMQVDSNTPNVVYVGTSTGAFFVSNNAGTSWTTRTPDRPFQISAIVAGTSAGEVFLGTLGDGVVHTTNSGASWNLGAARGLWSIPVLFIAVHPTDPAIIYVATGGQGMFKSSDGGVHWDPINNGLSTRFLLTLAIDKVAPETLYAGSAGAGVFITEDGGANWRPFNNQLQHLNVTAIRLNSRDHTEIYIGTEGGGLFKALR